MLSSCRSDADMLERRDFGCEYFECNLFHLIKKLMDVSGLFLCTNHAGEDVIDKAEHDKSHTTIEQEEHGTSEAVTEAVLETVTEAVSECLPAAVLEVPPSDLDANGPGATASHHLELALELEPRLEALPSALDSTLLLGAYIRSIMEELAASPVDGGMLLDRVSAMLKAAGCVRESRPTLKALTQDLKRYFGVEELMCHRFPDGSLRHAFKFPKPSSACPETREDPDDSRRMMGAAEWLDGQVEITGNRDDLVTMVTVKRELKAAFFYKTNVLAAGVRESEFADMVKAHFLGRGALFCVQAYLGGSHYNACFRGLRIKHANLDVT